MCSSRTSVLATAASLLLFGYMAWAQSNSASMLNAADRRFMDKAAEANMAEVQLGQLAEQNAQSQRVKDFGQRMATDHTQADNQLKQIAQKEDVKLPTKLSPQDEATLKRLEKMHGAAFDRAYMQDMVRDHRHDVNEFRRDEKNIQNTALKDWVINTLPTLDSHLTAAEQIAPEVGVHPAAMKSNKQGTTNHAKTT
jgi:putative membrane protein